MNIDTTKILTADELKDLIVNLTRKARTSREARLTLIVVRLAACCGMRVSEICGLRLRDVKLEGRRPHILVPAAISKSGRARRIPLWWDSQTLEDVTNWLQLRRGQDATQNDPFVVPVRPSKAGRCSRFALRNRWMRACKSAFGREVTIHGARHSFVSHALDRGRTLPEVRDAAGHHNVSITNQYLHVLDDDGTVGDLFDFGGA